MDNTILITGGTGKFGRVFLKHYLSIGWRVVFTSRSQESIDELIKEFGAPAGMLYGVEADFNSSDACGSLLAHLSHNKLSISHLINNARSLDSLAVREDGTTSRDVFLAEFDVDVVAPYEITVGLANSSGHQLKAVVNIGSQYGLVAPNPTLYEGTLKNSPIQYGVSKAALNHLTRELAVRLAPQGIRVNCVAFGGLEGRADEDFKRRYAALVPARRMLNAADLPGPVDFLLSDSSSAVNGQVLIADGGWSIW